jgi:SOS-response transcriptional repressor LexA
MIKLEGSQLAARIKQDVQNTIERMVKEQNVRPGLAAVRVGEDPASAVYVRNKIRACEEVGIYSEHHALPESTSTAELLDLIRRHRSMKPRSSKPSIRARTLTGFIRLTSAGWRSVDQCSCLVLRRESSSYSTTMV